MKASLTAGLKPQEADEISSEYLGSPMLRKRLIELLLDKQEVMLKKRRGEDAYASPNWSLMQADGIGYERALNDVISLLK